MVASNRKVIYELGVEAAKDAKAKLQEFGDLMVKQQTRVSEAATKSAQSRVQSEAQTSAKVQSLMEKAAQGQKGWYSQLSAIDKSTADQVFANRSKLMAKISGLEEKRAKAAEKQSEKEAKTAQKMIDDQIKDQEKLAKAAESAAEKAAEAQAKQHEKAERGEKKAERARKKALHEIKEALEEAGRAMVLLNLATEEDTEKAVKLWAAFEGGLQLVHSFEKGIHAGANAWKAWRTAALAASAVKAGAGAAGAAGAASGGISLAGGVAGLAAMFNPIGAAVGVAALAVGAFALACKHEADVIAAAAEKRKKAEEKADEEIAAKREKAGDTREDDFAWQASLRKQKTFGAGMGMSDVAREKAETAKAEQLAQADSDKMAKAQEQAEEQARKARSAAKAALGGYDLNHKSQLEHGPEGDDARSKYKIADKEAEAPADAAIAFAKERVKLEQEITEQHQKGFQAQVEENKQRHEAQLKAIEAAKDQLSLSLKTRDSIKQAVTELQKQYNAQIAAIGIMGKADQTKLNMAIAAAKKGDLTKLTDEQLGLVMDKGNTALKTAAEGEARKRAEKGMSQFGNTAADFGSADELATEQKKLAAATTAVATDFEKLKKAADAASVSLGTLSADTVNQKSLEVKFSELKSTLTVKFEAVNVKLNDEFKKWMAKHEKELGQLVVTVNRLTGEQKDRQRERDANNGSARGAT